MSKVGKQTNTGRTHFRKGQHPSPLTEFKRGYVPHNKGKDSKRRYECAVCLTRFYAYQKRKYCSIKCSASTKVGENNPNWIGGGWLRVRKIILAEQDYTCQSCRHREPEIMEVNHKLEKSQYPDLAHDKNNLEVLCPNCHRRKTNAFLKANKNSI